MTNPQATQPAPSLSFSDAVRIASGCKDYGGGYRGTDHFEAYQHGIATVVASLRAAAEKGLQDTQARALHTIGADSAPAIPAPEGGERAAFEAWMKGLEGYPYAGKFADRMWQGWQARADLAAQPQAVALTDEQILNVLRSITNEPPVRLPPGWVNFARAIERAHGIQTKEPTNG